MGVRIDRDYWPSNVSVDRVAEIALSGGGRPSKAATDEGFMYSRGFRDPDGHLWDIMWMAPDGTGG
jgi:predicted lactoylglutathione lyase